MKIFGVVGTAVMFLACGTAVAVAQQPDEKPRQEEAKPEQGKQEHPQEQKQGERPQQREAPKAEQREAPKADQRAQQDNQKRAQDNAKQAQDNQRKAQQQEQHAQQDNQKRAQQEQQRARQDQQKQVQQNQKAQQQNARDQQKARDDQQRRAEQDRNRAAPANRSYPAQSDGRQAAYHGRIPENNFHEHFGQQHHFRFHRPEIVEGRPRFQYSGYWFELVDPWPVGWGYDDDVYVDYVDDQYYLFDPEHPGARIVINVVL